MEEEIDKPGAYQPRKRARIQKYYTDKELLDILESSSGDEAESDTSFLNESDEERNSESESERQEILEESENPVLVNWKNDPIEMVSYPFTKVERLLIQPTENTPVGFFRLLLTDEFLSQIVEETNNYATEIFLSAGIKEKSRITAWRDLTVQELLVFLGVYLHMGNEKMRRVQDYWKKDPFFHNEAISKSISRNRFLLILRSLHFSTNLQPGDQGSEDRLHKIRPVIDYFNKRMAEVYYPDRELALDESMILWRGRLIFRHYIKNKRHKYGIKLYMLATPNGIVQKFAVYTSTVGDLGSPQHTQKVVFHLLHEKLNVGHHIYMDNYYNSFELAKALLDKKTHCTGTLRTSRKHTPKTIQTAKLRKGETVAQYSKGIMIGKRKDKREVCYISSEFQNNMIEVEDRRHELKSKPEPIVNYNKYMSGIDRQDQMLSYYLAERKTLRWYKKLFMHTIEMIVINSHSLYNKYSAAKMPLHEFRMSIIKSLLPPIEKQHVSRNQEHMVVKREFNPEKKKIPSKRWKSCSMEGKRTDTIYECPDCPECPGYGLKCTIYHK